MSGFDWLSLFAGEKVRQGQPARTACWAAEQFCREGIDRILDVGCGQGRNGFYLASQCFAVTGLDLFTREEIPWHDYSSVKSPGNRSSSCGSFTYVQGKADALPFPNNCFQGIFCFGLLHCLTPDPLLKGAPVLAEVHRVLDTDGLAVFTALWTDTRGMGLPEICCVCGEQLAGLLSWPSGQLNNRLVWESQYPRPDQLFHVSAQTPGTCMWELESLAVVDDHSLTGWQGIYWRLMIRKKRLAVK